MLLTHISKIIKGNGEIERRGNTLKLTRPKGQTRNWVVATMAVREGKVRLNTLYGEKRVFKIDPENLASVAQKVAEAMIELIHTLVHF